MTDPVSPMHADHANLADLLAQARDMVLAFHEGIAERPAGYFQDISMPDGEPPEDGLGALAALDAFHARHLHRHAASAGPRYLGFVTGGSTPAALAADWLVAGLDQNTASPGDSAAVPLSEQAYLWLRSLFGLPETFDGAFTTGATGANFMCLLAAREWAGEGAGIDIARQGLSAGPEIAVYSACPHASFVKVARFSGIGSDAIRPVDRLGVSEAMDTAALEAALGAAPAAQRKIVCASAGTVTGNAFDDLEAVAAICRKYDAWLHVDGAFGLFAGAVPELAHLTAGVERADSITCDGHKWLNVPYDCGFYFTKRIDLIERAAGALPAYLDVDGGGFPHYLNRALEGSQRYRALPVWMTLMAYGAAGVRQIVRDNCGQAARLGRWIEASDRFELLTPVILNVVCFRARPPAELDADVFNGDLLDALNAAGEVFMTPGAYEGKGGIRAAFSNWMTREEDVVRIMAALDDSYDMTI